MDLILNSKVLKDYDYRQVDLSPFAVPLTVDQVLLEHALLKFRTRFARTVDADQVENRDVVTISCRSDLPRFSRSEISVRVGLGMMSRELESQLIGLKIGETARLIAKDTPVEVSVLSIRREEVPELTEELVAAAFDPDLRTVADVYAKCAAEQFVEELDAPADEALPYLSRTVAEHAEIIIDQDELAAARNNTMAMIAHLVSDDSDELSDELKEYVQQMDRAALSLLQMAALGQAEMKKRIGKGIPLSDYQAYVARTAEMEGKPLKQVQEEKPANAYAVEMYGDYYMTLLEDYILEELTRLGREMNE